MGKYVMVMLLMVFAWLSSSALAQEKTIYIAIDLSASMNGLWDGATKWEKCQESLKEVAKTAPSSLSLGIIFFGGEAEGCDAVQMAVSAKRYNRNRIRMGFAKVKPFGGAPLVKALEVMADRIPVGAKGADLIILTDGGPFCGGELNISVEGLLDQYQDLRISLLGLNLSPENADLLGFLPAATKGWGFNAANGRGITQGLLAIFDYISFEPDTTITGHASLALARKVTLGERLAVTWSGPAGRLDAVAIYQKKSMDSFRLFDWAPIREDEPLILTAPDIPGNYEVRYLTGPTGSTIANAKLKVKKAKASITAPSEVVAGADLQVIWKGPTGFGDRLAIYRTHVAEPYALAVVSDLSQSPVKIATPTASGEFELRYETGSTGQILARQTITLTPPKVALSCPRQVSAGTLIEVRWQGPAADGDTIAIVAPGNHGKKHRFERVLATSGTVKLLAPDKPGPYQVQYISGENDEVLKKQTFRAMPVRATIKLKKTIVAGTDLEIGWTGPGGPGDLIGIYGNSKEGQMTLLSYLKIGELTPVKLLAPDYPGSYRVRYVTGQSKRILAETQLKVTDVQATVTLLSRVKAGQDFEVKYTGPKNRLDVIALMDYANPQVPRRVVYKPVGRSASVFLKAPGKPGLYEVRYIMGKSQRVLAKSWLRIR